MANASKASLEISGKYKMHTAMTENQFQKDGHYLVFSTNLGLRAAATKFLEDINGKIKTTIKSRAKYWSSFKKLNAALHYIHSRDLTALILHL